MCISPNHVWVERGPMWEKTPVPCKKCWQCKSNRVSDYVGRSLCEASTSDWSVCLTLTYAPRADMAEVLITPSHFQKFIRSLRKRGHKIRYLAVGEYGELKDRAHFHVLLFGIGPKPQIPHKKNSHHDWWPHGHVYADWSHSDGAARYVCKYLFHQEKGEYWFTLSKKPPLGAAFFQLKAREAVRNGVLPSTWTYLPPGGESGKEYLLSGASRRDYLFAVTDELSKTLPRFNERMSEWVRVVYDKETLLRKVKAAELLEKENPELSFQRFVDEINSGRASNDVIAALMADIDDATMYGVISGILRYRSEEHEGTNGRRSPVEINEAQRAAYDAFNSGDEQWIAFLRGLKAKGATQSLPTLSGAQQVSSGGGATRRSPSAKRNALAHARANRERGAASRQAQRQANSPASRDGKRNAGGRPALQGAPHKQ